MIETQTQQESVQLANGRYNLQWRIFETWNTRFYLQHSYWLRLQVLGDGGIAKHYANLFKSDDDGWYTFEVKNKEGSRQIRALSIGDDVVEVMDI